MFADDVCTIETTEGKISNDTVKIKEFDINKLLT